MEKITLILSLVKTDAAYDEGCTYMDLMVSYKDIAVPVRIDWVGENKTSITVDNNAASMLPGCMGDLDLICDVTTAIMVAWGDREKQADYSFYADVFQNEEGEAITLPIVVEIQGEVVDA